MSNTVDNRAVQLGFDNKQFESGVQDSLKSLDSLKKGLNLSESAKGLTNLSNAGKSFTLSSIAESAQNVSNRFSAMGIVGMTILQNLTNATIEFTKKLVIAALGIDNMKGGFAEYEQGLTAFQTILANTKSAGATVEDVNKILLDLNKYANLTVYSFGDMTKAIGLFTAQGVSLPNSLTAIKGIFNIVSLTGGNADKANSAIYQLSQALASGTVRAQDWISVINAGIGGTDFQKQLQQTARVHGVAVDDMIKKEGSFKASLTTGWLTSAILLETLQQYTGDLSAETLKSIGYTDAQIKQIQELGATANESATRMKSITQLVETLKSNMVTSWATSFKIVIGDLDEASALWSYVGNTIGGILQESADSRNNMLQGWKTLGGRALGLEAIKNVLSTVVTLMDLAKTTWKQMFPSKGPAGEGLFKITKLIKEFTDQLRPSIYTIDKLKIIFSGLFAILDIGKMAISALLGSFGKLNTGGIKPFLTSILDSAYKISFHILMIRSLIKSNNSFGKSLQKVKDFIDKVKTSILAFEIQVKTAFLKIRTEFYKVRDAVEEFKQKFADAFNFKKVDTSGIGTFFDKFKIRFAPLETLAKIIGVVFDGLVNLLKKSAPVLLTIGTILGKFLSGLGSAIQESITTLDFTKVFDIINSGLLVALILAIKNFISKGSKALDGVGGMFSGVTGILDGVRGSLQAYQTNLKANTLLMIAGAIAILVASLLVLSMINSEKLTTAMLAISALFVELTLSMQTLSAAGGGGVKGAATLSITLTAISVSLLILTAAVKSLADIDPKELQNGLVALAAISTGLVLFSKEISAGGKSFIGTAISLILLGVALEIIVNVVNKLGNIDADVLKKGLIAIGAILTELAAFTQLSSKMGVSTGLGILALSASLLVIYSAVDKFGNMDIGVLKQGLITIGAILLGIAAFTRLTGSGANLIATGVGMTILAASMLIFVVAIEKMGLLSWDQITKGLATMGGVLLAVVAAVNLMPKDMIVTSVGLVLIGGAIYILTQALIQMSKLTWEEIAKGLATLAGALLVISVAMYAMQGALPGAVALMVVAGALAILTPVLKQLGKMKIQEVAMALGVLAGMFIILGIAGAVLTPVVPTLLGLAGAIVLLGIAIAAIGAGVLMFSTGLAALAVSGTIGATALVAIVAILLGIVPMIVTTIVNAIIQFATLITAAAPAIGAALLALLLTLCDVVVKATPALVLAIVTLLLGAIAAIRTVVPEAVDAILFLIGELLKSLATKVPEFVQSAYDILIGFLSGIRDNIGEVVTVVGEIVTEFLDALALKIPDIIDSGFNLLISFIDGITKAIEDNGGDLTDAIGRLATAIITGLTDGLLGGIGSIVTAIGNIGSAIITALKTLLGIASPSKVMDNLGDLSTQGFVRGLGRHASSVVDAAKNLGNKAISGMGAAISRINDTLNNNLDINPTIRPVVDLERVISGGRDIDNILGKKSLTISQSMQKLSAMAAGMPGNNGVAGGETIQPNSQGTSVTFNQNNYSPKALSQFDIYRDTRNQLLMAKGLVGTTS